MRQVNCNLFSFYYRVVSVLLVFFKYESAFTVLIPILYFFN
jgi:hypothetical protein